MKKLLMMLLALVIGFAPVVVAAQTSGSGGMSGSSDKSTSGSTSSSPSTSPSGSSSTTSPSASPSTGAGASTDMSHYKTQADCERAGGKWQASTSTCQSK